MVLHGGALAGVLQELQQKWLQHVGAAVERGQDVQQPPTPLAAFPATQTLTPVWLGPRFVPQSAVCNAKRGGVSRFGAGVGRHLLHHLAVRFVLHEAVVAAQLHMWAHFQKKENLPGFCFVEKSPKLRTFGVRTLSMVATKSCSV